MANHELMDNMEKFMVFSSDVRRRILVSLLEARNSGNPVTLEDLQNDIHVKNIKQQLSIMQQVGFVETKIIDIPNRSPHPAYFLTDRAMSALKDIGFDESLVKSILEKYNERKQDPYQTY